MLWNIILLASIAFQTTEALSTPTSMTSSTRRLLPTTTTPPPTTTIRNRQLTTNLLTTTTVSTTFSDITTSPLPLRLKLQAAPDYPVTEGQVVVLQCLVHSGSVVGLISWQWVRYSDNLHLKLEPSSGAELRLTNPQQSGSYSCSAMNSSDVLIYSEWRMVMIVSVQKAVGGLGMAGFAFSLLALILVLGLLFWLGWQKFSTTSTSLNNSTGLGHRTKDTEMSPNPDDVYMNFSGPNEDYSNLDPSTKTADGLYSNFE